MKKKLIFGIGTGRCGTVSLCTLLNSQKYSSITHEMRPLVAWNGSPDKLDKRIKTILSQKGSYVGDIAFFYLPYIDYILQHYPGAKIICLKRAKNQVVESYIRKTPRRNHWVKHPGLIWHKCEWDKCFPKYHSLLKRNAIGKYWEEYYETVDHLKLDYPESILMIDMYEALNTETGIKKILDFLDIEKRHWVIKKDIRKNAIQY